MAFRRRSFGGRARRGRTSPVRARRWTAETGFNVALPANSTLEVTLVAPADYRQSATLEADQVTCARIRGIITIVASAAPTVANPLMIALAIYRIDVDAVALTVGGGRDPSVAQSLIDEDVLWMDHFFVGGVTSAPHDMRREFDVKAMRRLTDSAIVLDVVNLAGSQAAQVSLQGRSLLIGG